MYKRQTRTPDTRITIQRATLENPEQNAHSRDSAAAGATVDPENGPIDPDLQTIIEGWPDLPEPVKAGILAMVHGADPRPGATHATAS